MIRNFKTENGGTYQQRFTDRKDLSCESLKQKDLALIFIIEDATEGEFHDPTGQKTCEDLK